MTSPAAPNLRTQYKLIKPADSPLNQDLSTWLETHQPNTVSVLPPKPNGDEPIFVTLHDLTGEREFEEDFEAQFEDLIVEYQEEFFEDPDILLLMEDAISRGVTRW